MIVLRSKDTGLELGQIDDDDFQFLVDQLEEESEDDTDYYVTSATIELLQSQGASQSLVEMLKNAVGDSEGLEISWAEE